MASPRCLPLRHVIAAAFAGALPPINAYLIPLLVAAFLLALILRELTAHVGPAWAQERPPRYRPRGLQGRAVTSPGARSAHLIPPPHNQNIPLCQLNLAALLSVLVDSRASNNRS